MTIETITTGTDLAPMPVGLDRQVQDVESWLQRFDMYSKMARGLVHSAFVPAAYKPNDGNIPPLSRPEERAAAIEQIEANATGAMMLGGALGLDPLTSLQQIYLIHGRPGMYSRIKVALCQAASHDIWTEEFTAERVTVCGRRKGWPEDRVERITITKEDAERAGWDKTNANYRKTPADMLYARAAGRVTDRVAADLLHGIATVEEIDDRDAPDDSVRVVTRVGGAEIQAAAPAAAQQPAAAAVEASTSQARAEAPDTAPQDVSGAVELISPQALKLVQTKLTQAGIKLIDDRRDAVQLFARRPLESTKELRADEADQVLRGLAELGKSDDPVRTLHDWLREPEPPVVGQAEEQGGGDRG